jgi:diacylglycerol kinase (ATP)
VQGGATLLVVVGGDGSVNEVVNGVADLEGFDLGVLPHGTGGDFVRTYGISRRLEESVATVLAGNVREFDVGLVTYRTWAGAEGRAYFANIASAGISGAIAQRANDTSKALGGKVSYYWATLAVFVGWQTGELRVSVDDEIRGGRMIDVLVANGRYLAGGMMMCPDAEPDDGLFDVMMIGDVTKRDLLFVLPKTYRGKHLPHPRLELLRGRVVSVDADEPLPIELDGEQPGTTPVRFEVVPRALKLRVPATS